MWAINNDTTISISSTFSSIVSKLPTSESDTILYETNNKACACMFMSSVQNMATEDGPFTMISRLSETEIRCEIDITI